MARPTTEPKVSRGGAVHHLPPPAIPHPPVACYSQHHFRPYYPKRKLAIVALDPSVRDGGGILRTQIEIPNESLSAEPPGYRVHVIDCDATSGAWRASARLPAGVNCTPS